MKTNLLASAFMLSAAIAGLLLGVPSAVQALAGKLDRPSLSFPSGFENREAIMKVLSSPDFKYAGGSFVNAHSILNYQGGAAPLNEFLVRLAACKGVKVSVSFSPLEGDAATTAWTLDHNAWGDPLAFHIKVNTGLIKEAEVKVPKKAP